MNRMQQQDVNMRQKQQENSLFVQAQELNQMLDQQEAAMNNGPPQGGLKRGIWPPPPLLCAREPPVMRA